MAILSKFRQAMAIALGLAILAPAPSQAQGRTFFAEGSDTIMALGARHIAMGGTGTATANDPHAVYYNAALLATIDRAMITGTVQLDAELRPYSFIGAAIPLPFTRELGFDATIGLARYNRVHARATGAYAAGDIESIFLRYLLPGITGVFDGEIDSKTLVNRFALGISPHGLPGLSLGVNLDWIDCETNSCGVQSGSVGYEERSVKATALSYGISAAYTFSDRFTIGAAYTDIDTVLDVFHEVTDSRGTRTRNSRVGLPSRLNLEASAQVTDDILVAVGYQKFWGDYGSYSLDFQTVHLGAEYEIWDNITARAGAWAPLKLEASNGLNLDPGILAAPTAGIGWAQDGFSADLAVYYNPIMVMHGGLGWPSVDLSVGYTF